MPKIPKDPSHRKFRTQLIRASIRRSAPNRPSSTLMTLKAFSSLITIATLVALSGCQSGPQRWAWWKHDSAPDASAVARSAEPTLPSAQSSPQAVAVAGLTPAAPPSSTNLAATASPAVGTGVAGLPSLPPSVSIPVTSTATLAGAPPTAYPNAANALADKLTSAPSATTKAATPALPSNSLPTSASAVATSPTAAAAAATPAAGPYDPKGYKPTAALASSGTGPTGEASEPDRYGMSSANKYTTSMAGSTPTYPAPAPTSRYGATTTAASSATRTAAPVVAAAPAPSNQMPAQSAAPMADRYAMPSTLPSSASMNPTTPVSPATTSVPAANASLASTATVTPAAIPVANPTPVGTTAAAGAYRPGGTSSYSPSGAPAAIEVATRPAPPSATIPTTAPVATPGAGSEPWAPPVPSVTPTGTRTY